MSSAKNRAESPAATQNRVFDAKLSPSEIREDLLRKHRELVVRKSWGDPDAQDLRKLIYAE